MSERWGLGFYSYSASVTWHLESIGAYFDAVLFQGMHQAVKTLS